MPCAASTVNIRNPWLFDGPRPTNRGSEKLIAPINHTMGLDDTVVHSETGTEDIRIPVKSYYGANLSSFD
jgi:hypothetical protein